MIENQNKDFIKNEEVEIKELKLKRNKESKGETKDS